MSFPQPTKLKQDSSAKIKGNIGITPLEKQLCEETVKATREQCMAEIEEQIQVLKQEKAQLLKQKEHFWAEKTTVAALEHKHEVSEAERKGLKAENDALKEHNKELLALNKSLLEKLYEELDDSRLRKQGVDYKEGGRTQSYVTHLQRRTERPVTSSPSSKIITIPLKRQDEEPNSTRGPPRPRITLSFGPGKDVSGGSEGIDA